MKKSRKKAEKGRIDNSEAFDEFLAREGLLAEAEDAAIKEIIADQINIVMDKQGTKVIINLSQIKATKSN